MKSDLGDSLNLSTYDTSEFLCFRFLNSYFGMLKFNFG